MAYTKRQLIDNHTVIDADLLNHMQDGIVAAEQYTDTKVAELVNSSPETLDTLNELATALGNDPNFATTIATQIGKKADSATVEATYVKKEGFADAVIAALPVYTGEAVDV